MTNELPADTTTTPARPLSRLGTVAGGLGCGLGLVFFLVGMYDQPAPKTRAVSIKKADVEHLQAHVAPAPTYSQINSEIYGVNSAWKSDFSKLKQDIPDLFERVVRTSEMKQAALTDRLRTRAFDTAPPAVPHPVEQRTTESCLVCHSQGMKIADKIATKMSHPLLGNCTQCHVEQVSSVPSMVVVTKVNKSEVQVASDTPGNTFDGVKRAGPGTRLLPGLPPSIPHTVFMRNDCMSCHGLIARPGLRTTHPWLQNCQQCHAADAELERVFATVILSNTP